MTNINIGWGIGRFLKRELWRQDLVRREEAVGEQVGPIWGRGFEIEGLPTLLDARYWGRAHEHEHQKDNAEHQKDNALQASSWTNNTSAVGKNQRNTFDGDIDAYNAYNAYNATFKKTPMLTIERGENPTSDPPPEHNQCCLSPGGIYYCAKMVGYWDSATLNAPILALQARHEMAGFCTLINTQNPAM